MKSAVFALALAAAATAQDVSSLAKCGQTCASNMMAAGKAKELGCSEGDLKCLCQNANFSYGLRDCSHAVCSGEDASKVVAYGMELCKNAGVTVSGGSGSGGAGASGSGSSGSSATGGSGSSGEAGNGGNAQLTTIYSTFTSDGKEMTTPVATSTIGGGAGGSGASGTEGGAGGAMVTTFTSDGHTIVSTMMTMASGSGGSGSEGSGSNSTATGTEGGSGSGGSGGAGSTGGSGGATGTGTEGSGSQSTSDSGAGASASGSKSSSAFAPQLTAAPGLLAVAGIAAFLI